MKRTKAQRLMDLVFIEARFPKGHTGGKDTLSKSINIGNSFRSIDRADFKLVKTGTMKKG